MGSLRKVRKVTRGTRAVDGAGVHLVRVIGRPDVKDYDPFLMLDAFDSTNPADYTAGFPWHPHRGIETITYLISGDIEHGDSLGNHGSIRDGDCQWMTAGSGIIHQEMPQASPHMLGAQLWLNLPASDKMCDPAYGDIDHADVPVIEENGTTVRILAGRYGETPGAFQGGHIDATYLDVEMAPNASWDLETERERTLFIYIVEGSASFADDDTVLADHQAVLFEDGDEFHATAASTGVRFLLLMAEPLHEPVAWGGPIVMNTRAQLEETYRDLEADTFLKVGDARSER